MLGETVFKIFIKIVRFYLWSVKIIYSREGQHKTAAISKRS